MARTSLGNVLHWPLDNYPSVVPVAECAFNGILYSNDPDYQCDSIWDQRERDALARALHSAAGLMEPRLGYFLSPQFVEAEEHEWDCPVVLDWGYVIGQGIKAVQSLNVLSSDFTSDPYLISVTLPTGALEDEIHLYETTTGYELHPVSRTTVAGVTTLSIPKCRMAKWANLIVATKTDPIDYTDASAFLTIADVYLTWEYLDQTTGVTLFWPTQEVCNGSVNTATVCAFVAEAGCLQLHDKKRGIVTVSPGSYSAGVWTKSTAQCCAPSKTRIYYQAGLDPITTQLEDALVRLAHTLLPLTPCGCDTTKYYWGRDREEFKVMTREILNNPFGAYKGALFAYQVTVREALGQGGQFSGKPRRSQQGWSTSCVPS